MSPSTGFLSSFIFLHPSSFRLHPFLQPFRRPDDHVYPPGEVTGGRRAADGQAAGGGDGVGVELGRGVLQRPLDVVDFGAVEHAAGRLRV